MRGSALPSHCCVMCSNLRLQAYAYPGPLKTCSSVLYSSRTYTYDSSTCNDTRHDTRSALKIQLTSPWNQPAKHKIQYPTFPQPSMPHALFHAFSSNGIPHNPTQPMHATQQAYRHPGLAGIAKKAIQCLVPLQRVCASSNNSQTIWETVTHALILVV